MNFLDADVPDPTDFPPPATAPGLRALDGSFRCDICGELYDAPVTISCGHCFCSTCIRSALATKQECPSCRKTANEGHIRPNPVLESVISSWKEARPYVLGLISRKNERESSSTQSDKGAPKKRKRGVESSSSIDALDGDSLGPSRYPFNTPRGADATTPKPQSRIKKLKPKSDNGKDITVIPSSDTEEQELTPLRGGGNGNPKPDSLVVCPMCQKKVRYRILNAHLDNECKDPAGPSDSAATSWSKIMGGPAKNGQHKGKHKKKDSDSDDEYPLPLATYATLKDRQLKDMLAEQGLPLTGDRPIWEQRHQRWVMFYNANLDKSLPNRKTKAELKKDLKRWEDERSKKKKTVVSDVVHHQIEYKVEFARLTSLAKQTRVKHPARPDSSASRSSPSPTESKPTLPIPHPSASGPSDDTIVVDSEGEC
ncbi:hypothetical protein BDN70DRAFT_796760 [Pholiota conissans]|uniref:Postreplication repair E3 ubiquitin-protein ligase RAD18 n=1 Tax=Pholiota conissans TaxID=109636 RepID=A0A9P6D5T8_9AGAR|nr:hypothetical protein BDN70DRAFT_796760 [Pholiota conissans]